MLSLLSLIIASGTVLRADTEQWEARNYPDPRANFTQCNVGEGSTLCDPDHMLTDAWRQTIQESIALQMERLKEADIPYKAEAPEECRRNSTESPAIFIILAKRILTASNQSTTTNDLELFGEDLIRSFELNNQPCKNYILLLGVEGKTIKVWAKILR
ncbi:unnamed protein product [Auanema sp. JU1783]|nr:unnamed protein product [Auanema sp. JU1783]